MRMTVTRGGEQRGLAAQGRAIMLITMTSWVAGTLYKPVTLKTSSTRRNELSPSSRLKLTSYADNIIAAREAEAAGSGDALMLNSRGRVACSTIANLFAVLGDDIATPPVEEGALPGTIRRHVMATEQPIQPDELKKADGIFLTNSLRLVRPVQSLDGLSTSAAAGDRIMEVFAAQCLRIKEQCGIDPRAVDSTPS
jgi:branched-chain amino acid aminotransferase